MCASFFIWFHFVTVLGSVSTRLHKQVGEPLQRVLIHGVHHVEVSYAEVHYRSSVGHWPIPLSALINLFFCYFSLRNLQKKESMSKQKRGLTTHWHRLGMCGGLVPTEVRLAPFCVPRLYSMFTERGAPDLNAVVRSRPLLHTYPRNGRCA